MWQMRVVSASILAMLATVALAHARLQNSVPVNGAIVSASPMSVTLKFSEPARLTACWLQKGGGPKEKVGRLVASAAKEISVPIGQPLQPGSYVLSWRVMGDDGHIVPGQIHF